MVEPSSCFAQGLDHAPHKSNANSQASIASALGGSVSFGRFLSESLDWGKWSSFCQKRYLEEAAKYSTPGSVAQKKAFFEARYKKKHTTVAQPEAEAEAKAEVEECRDESSKIFDSDENQHDGYSVELSKPLSDKKPLEEICVNDQNVGGSTEKKVSPTLKSFRSTPFLKDNRRNESTTPISGKNKRGSIERKKSSSTPTSVHASVNFTRSRTGPTTPTTNKCSPVMKKAKETKFITGSTTPLTNKPPPAMKNAKETKASSNGVSIFASLTPHSEHGRVGSPLKQTPSAEKQVDVKMHYVGYSNRSSIKGDSAQSEVASSSNMLKTNQRVEKRKKFFNHLENKAGQEEVKKLQLQGTDEGIAGNEIKGLRKSLCFKARPLPDVYRNTGLLKHEVKKEIAGNEIKGLRQSLCFKARPLPDFYRNTGLPNHEVEKSPSQKAMSPQSRKEQPQSKTKSKLSLPTSRRPVISDRSMQIGENGRKESCRSAILKPTKSK